MRTRVGGQRVKHMSQFLMIVLGGAVGTGARYAISGYMLRTLGASFPYGTITVNFVGSFLITLIMHIGLSSELISPTMRIVLTTGVMGGFTTYSSFSYETLQYFQEGETFKAMTNTLMMVCSCLIAAWLGLMLAKRILGN